MLKSCLALVLASLVCASVSPTLASNPKPIDVVIDQLLQGSLASSDVVSTEASIIESLRTSKPTVDQISTLWGLLSDGDAAALATLPVVKALAELSESPKAREALWSELADSARRSAGNRQMPSSNRSLIDVFERHRSELLTLLPPVRETEGGGDEMAYLMTSSRVFGDDIWQSLFDMVTRNPGAVARLIERERERGRPVKWEYQGFEGMMKWKQATLVAGAPNPPKSLDALDANGETFIIIFNALHSLEDWYREQMLRGLGPIELFNAAVGGEQELYRLGTSGYRDFLHPVILKGIKKSGSFEAFLDEAALLRLGDDAVRAKPKRGLIFLRIAASFGMLDSVLDTVRDRDRFVTDAIESLGDPRSFATSGSMVVDLVVSNSKSPQALAFKRALLDRLYALYGVEADASRRSVFGSMLSAYQTVTGDRRDRAIDAEFPLSGSMQRLPFDRLFKAEGRNGHIHRIFMRMHDDIDGVSTFASFRTVMRSMGASVRDEKTFTVFRVGSARRAVEIYANKPDGSGVRQGINDLSRLLRTTGVETIVGRGHTGIISPLQTDSRRLLGDGVTKVAMVIVGTCGGDASVREMIGTFGYVPFVTTKSTGRQAINNAIMEAYISALLALPVGASLPMTEVLDRALARFLRDKGDEDLREDAKLYQVNLATVLVARLFDTHVRRHGETVLQAAR